MIEVNKLKQALDRLEDLEAKYDLRHTDRMTMSLQLVQVANQLDIDRLLEFDDSNFIHDMSGINAHVIPDSNEFQSCFYPRCGK